MNPPSPYPPLSDADWPVAIEHLRAGFAGRLNVYRVMAHNPALMRAWAEFRDHVVVRNALGAQRSEVVILRAGYRLGSEYEWNHHVVRGRACGLTDERISSLKGPLAGMSAEDAIIACAVDDLMANYRLSAESRERLRHLVGTDGLFDVMATVGHYSVLGFIVNSFDTPLDDDIAAALAVRPLPLG